MHTVAMARPAARTCLDMRTAATLPMQPAIVGAMPTCCPRKDCLYEGYEGGSGQHGGVRGRAVLGRAVLTEACCPRKDCGEACKGGSDSAVL